MAHGLAPEVETELDEIWYYTARESGSTQIANRLIDSITERFFLLAGFPTQAAFATIYGPVCAAFLSETRSSSTASRGRTCTFSTWYTADVTLKRKWANSFWRPW